MTGAAALYEPPPDASLAPLTEAEFLKFSRLIEKEVGIHLSDGKRPLLVTRLGKRIRQLRLRSFTDYFEYVESGADPAERVGMFDAISTNETRFFREPKHFELMTSRIFPRWKAEAAAGHRPKSISLWSAGCSTGEEPYSLAMTLLAHFDSAEWDLRIDATDLSTRVLDAAREGLWPIRKANDIPSEYLRRFMLRGTRAEKGFFKAGDELRSIVRFGALNLTSERYSMPADYDFVLCRNVLIYFTHATRMRVVATLLSHLATGGYLFLGHAETLAGIADGPRSVIPTVYVK